MGAAPVGIAVWDRDLQCVVLNEALAAIAGLPRDEAATRPPADCLPGDWGQWRPHFEAALDGDTTQSVAIEGRNFANRWFAASASFYPISTGHGDVTGVALICSDVTSQRRAQRALERSEERYRLLAEALPALVSLTDVKGEPFYWNRAFFEYTGLSEDEARDPWNHDFVVREDILANAEEWARNTEAGRPAEAEVRIRRRDGVFRWHVVRAVPLGIPPQWLLTATDIDDAKRSQQRLREVAQETAQARALLNEIVHQAPLGIAFFDLDARFVHVNTPFAEFDGVPLEGHPGRTIAQLAPGLWDRVGEVFGSLAAGAQDLAEFEIGGGAGRVWNLRWYAVHGQAGEIFGVGVLAEEVTERRRAEANSQLLGRVTRQLAASLNYAHNIGKVARLASRQFADIVMIDIFADARDVRRVATAAREPGQKRLVDLVRLRDWAINDSGERFAERLADGGDVILPRLTPAWIEAHAPDAEQREAALALGASSLISLPLRAKGQLIGALTLVMADAGREFSADDLVLTRELAHRIALAVENSRLFAEATGALAALRENEQRLREANAAKDEFLSLLSHELRTPITTIVGNAHVLQDHIEDIDPAVRDDALADISGEGTRLGRIIENLLALARLDHGPDLEVEPLHLRRITDRVLEARRKEHPERRYQLTTPATVLIVDGNDVYLEQILRNLITNAERYSPPDTPIEVEIEERAGAAAIDVLDRGVGIEPDEIAALFEPFYRSSRTAGVQGIGVGLSVCKRLVEFLGGTLSARPRDGGGSVFTVSLPLAPHHDE
jgi:PAS domain S-box-containing protein